MVPVWHQTVPVVDGSWDGSWPPADSVVTRARTVKEWRVSENTLLALRVELRPGAPVDPTSWPDSVPAVAHLLRHGLEVPAGVTFLVGENGAGKHVLCATHSPLLTALPGARIVQLDDDGITPVTWDELDVVRHWTAFLDSPGRYLRHQAE